MFGNSKYQLCDQCLDIVLFGRNARSDGESRFIAEYGNAALEEKTRALRAQYAEDIGEYERLLRIREARERHFGSSSGAVAPPRFDVFISYSNDDRDLVANLTSERIKRGLRVWYDKIELKIGDSLRRKIDDGLAQSRFGVVIFSHSFFARNWTQYELDGLVTREMDAGEQVILPIWHGITKEFIIKQSPSLANKVARSTDEFTIAYIAEEIVSVVTSNRR